MKNIKNLILTGSLKIPKKEILNALSKDVLSGLNVDLVTIWYFNNDCTSLTCEHSVDKMQKRDLVKFKLLKDVYPNYFKSIIEGVSIRVNDVYTNPQTIELVEDYFKPNHILSLLDYIIYEADKPVGLICCETTQSKRTWTDQDIDYVRALTVMAGVELKNAKKN